MEQCWEIIRPHFGKLFPQEITKDLCNAYIEHRRKLGVSDATTRTELSYMSAALKFAVDTKQLSSRPRIWRPPQPRPRSHVEEFHLSRAEAKVLIDGAEDWAHLRLWIILALGTAGRPLHILQLEWDRVDFHKRSLNLDDPKRDRTQKGRARVPMNQEVYDALVEAKRHAGSSGYVVEFNGKPVQSIKKSLAHLSSRVGVKASPYTLRHTAAVWMAEAGVPMAEIAQYMGHSDPKITYRIYARYSPTYLQRAANALQVVRGSAGTSVPALRNTG
jgi:integrase